MVSAWYYDSSFNADPREKMQKSPNAPVSIADLEKIGVLYWNFNIDDQLEENVEKLMKSRSYKNRDVISISKETLPNYDEKLKSFFTEHLHDDEEIRLIMEGSGYFDVRDGNDEWIRIHTTVGDLIVIPAGIYHRFILDTGNYIKAMRIFKEDPKWTPINRSCDAEKNVHRIEYLESVGIRTANKMF